MDFLDVFERPAEGSQPIGPVAAFRPTGVDAEDACSAPAAGEEDGVDGGGVDDDGMSDDGTVNDGALRASPVEDPPAAAPNTSALARARFMTRPPAS